ncbi:cytochrome P450 [Kitasatospora sp. LaBMicrA B282]|uniref:cytochrome P450 n=1 Tax=Kitasatospora sp. LaBMicrA B282 TaxID=3420949 RepID=UPI003D113BD8
MTDTEPAPVQLPTARSCPFSPPDGYRPLREEGLARLSFPSGPVGWLVTRHSEAKALLTDPAFSARQEGLVPPVPTELHYAAPAEPGAFAKTDDPEHGHYRKLLTGFFTVRRVRELLPLIERITREQLDVLAAAGPGADLVEHFAVPVPSRVMSELVGIPETERAALQRHVDALGKITSTIPEAIDAITGLGEFLGGFVPPQLAQPGEGLVGDLVRGGKVDDKELMNLVSTLINGGFDTTGNMLAQGVFALLQHPDQLALLRERPELSDGAVEELLRYLTISHYGASRWALTDTEFAGQQVKEGEVVVVALGAANRDPERFAEPDRLDLTRDDHGHVAFGHGAHQCLGQHLARTTLAVAWRELFERFPSLHLAVPAEQITMRDDYVHYGPLTLPVTWTEESA